MTNLFKFAIKVDENNLVTEVHMLPNVVNPTDPELICVDADKVGTTEADIHKFLNNYQAYTYDELSESLLLLVDEEDLTDRHIPMSEYDIGVKESLTRINTVYGRPQVSGYGLFVGGYNGTEFVRTADKMDWASEVAASKESFKLSSPKYGMCAVGNVNYGIVAGGELNGGSRTNTTDKLDWYLELSSLSTSFVLPQLLSNVSGIANKEYGVMAGGTPDGANSVAAAQECNFATEVMYLKTSFNLTIARHLMASCANKNYGVFVGGLNLPAGTNLDQIDKVDWYTEITSAFSSNLAEPNSGMAGLANDNYAIVAGGLDAINNTPKRITWADETISILQSATSSLAIERKELAATGNALFGVFVGGQSIDDQVTAADRYDFIAEVMLAAGPFFLSEKRMGLGATSNTTPSSL